MRYGVVYKITNKLNGKIYIGQTVQSIGERWSKHKNKRSKARLISAAIKKYGPDNFEIEEVCSALSREALSKLEVALIRHHNSVTPNGYNLVIPDENYTMTEETVQRKSQSMKKLYQNKKYKAEWMKAIRSTERVDAIRESTLNRWQDPEYKKRVSEIVKIAQNLPEFRQKRKEIATEIAKKNFVPVNQYDMSLNFIRRFDNKQELEDNNFNIREIRPCCAGRRYTYKGFLWALDNKTPRLKTDGHARAIRVVSIKLSTREVRHHDSMAQAARDLNICSKNISAASVIGRGRVRDYIVIKESEFNGDIESAIIMKKRKARSKPE